MSKNTYLFFGGQNEKLGVLRGKISKLEDVLRIGGHLCTMVYPPFDESFDDDNSDNTDDFLQYLQGKYRSEEINTDNENNKTFQCLNMEFY